MLSKKVVKDIQSLGVKKHRDDAGLFIAEGNKIVRDLIKEVPQYIHTVYAVRSWMQEHKNIAVPVTEVSDADLQRISYLKTPHDALAVVKQFKRTEPVAEKGLNLYLDGIQDPGNLGTIIRTADWFGVQNIICSTLCADIYNPKVVQSTMASIARIAVWYDVEDNWLYKQKADMYAAALSGKPVNKLGNIYNGILLIGNESKGLRPAVLQLAKHQVTIPRIGEAESLNAAVAAGIILSHFTFNGNV